MAARRGPDADAVDDQLGSAVMQLVLVAVDEDRSIRRTAAPVNLHVSNWQH